MEEKKTKLTLEINGTVTTWEVPYDDCSVEDIIYGLYGIMVAQTFQPGSIANCMKEFGEDQMNTLSFRFQDE